MEKPCSRVLRKLSGELTTIQYCALRLPPDLRLRRHRPDLPGRSSSAATGSSVSLTDRRLPAVRPRRVRSEVLWLGNQGAEVSDLGDVPHLVPRHHPADLEEGEVAAARVGDQAVPFGL